MYVYVNILCTFDLGNVSTGNSITDTNNSPNTILHSHKLIQQEENHVQILWYYMYVTLKLYVWNGMMMSYKPF